MTDKPVLFLLPDVPTKFQHQNSALSPKSNNQWALVIKIVGEFQITLCHDKIELLKMLESLILMRFRLSFLVFFRCLMNNAG